MRRAIIGTLEDKGAGSEEILDNLTDYAQYLADTRQLSEADFLLFRLAQIFDKLSHLAPKYLHFQATYLDVTSRLGHFSTANSIHEQLKTAVEKVDVVAPSVRTELFFQDLYRNARSKIPSEIASVKERLKQLIDDHSNLLVYPYYRVIFTYFAVLTDDVDLAEKFNASEGSSGADIKDIAYQSALNSYIAAKRGEFGTSLDLLEGASTQLLAYHRRFEVEASDRLPALSIEERGIISKILALDIPHVDTDQQRDTLFKIGQFLNRDKAKLGLLENIHRQELSSDLEREDIRTRDRLQDLRDRLLRDATEQLLQRVFPLRQFTASRTNDYSALFRLEDVEDKIANADEKTHTFSQQSQNDGDQVDLRAIQQLLKPDEALVLHDGVAGPGLLTQCVTTDGWEYSLKTLDEKQLKQSIIDEKLLGSAVRASNDPSPQLDASTPNFPDESAYHLFQLFFGGIDKCLKGKRLVLLATDPDYFALPWNALLITLPPDGQEFHFRDASWLPRSFALSLLPSVQSLYRLRKDLRASRAHQNFLGVGNPDFQGNPGFAVPSLASLYSSRGVADKKAIRALPALPESEEELRSVAKALGSGRPDLLLGADATERSLRRRPLNDYRVISFATHAVVAGDMPGVTEPALVLSLEDDPASPTEDGLLTASKIANLTLDANVVILSACNTAASDGQVSGRGLSGLADAFFSAGARSVVVTQWAVFSGSAQKLGSGLITHAVSNGSVSVSEGLRQAMLDYVGGAKEDYLANPRFWAAFIVAGDGAVRPLDGDKEVDAGKDRIHLEWEHLLPDVRDGEFISGTKASGHLGSYAIGMEKPEDGKKAAGSYLVLTDATGASTVIDRDSSLAASGVVSLDGEIAVLGFIPKADRSTAAFHIVGTDNQIKLNYETDRPRWNFPIYATKINGGYLLLSIEYSFSLTDPKPSIIATSISDEGEVRAQRTYEVSIVPSNFLPKNVAITRSGSIVVAIGGSKWSTSVVPTAAWVNPNTGTRRFCASPVETQLIEIDPGSLDEKTSTIIDGFASVSLKAKGGQIFAAGQFTSFCRLEKGVRIVEFSETYVPKTIFQSNNVNSLEVYDFEAIESGFIVVGTTHTFLPTALTVAIKNLNEPVKVGDPWDDAFWEVGEQQGAAFVLLLDPEGSILGDRVFEGLRNSSLVSVISQSAHRAIAYGSAFGNRGWVAGLSVRGADARVH